ncbi:MAG: ribonuclease III [Actinobacteria bacterium]|nr:ribonuclease III [Actinomycetota bacterium]MBT6943782.1 ribonuclease III [Actinomycetota bacterium]
MSSPASAENLVIDHPTSEQPGEGAAASALDAFEAALGHRFADPQLLTSALTHRSWCAEHGGRSNERLEFLGDAVLGLAVADTAFRSRPDHDEGDLAKIRSAVVSEDALADAARSIGLGEVLLLGRGEVTSGGRDKSSILCDAMEAVVGAVFLDAGHARSTEVVHGLLAEPIRAASLHPGDNDHKTRLQEMVAQGSHEVPRYLVTSDGPEHETRFRAVVEVGDQAFGPGHGTSKKRAEQAAAEIACASLVDDHTPMFETTETTETTGDKP